MHLRAQCITINSGLRTGSWPGQEEKIGASETEK